MGDPEQAKPEVVKVKRTNRLNEETLAGLYPHVKPGTLHFMPNENKQACVIACVFEDPDTGEVCGREREVRTSDLFQVDKCDVCTIKARRAKAKARRTAKKVEKVASMDDDEAITAEEDELYGHFNIDQEDEAVEPDEADLDG